VRGTAVWFSISKVIVLGWLLAGGHGLALAQIDNFPRLGLSASSTSLVDSLSAAPGEPFVAYMIAMGPGDDQPVPFPVTEISWIKHTGCCGVLFEVLDVVYNPALEHVGDPLSGVTSTAPECLEQDILLLATITFVIHYPTQGVALMPAGATSPGLDCAGEGFLFFDLLLNVTMEDGVISAVPDDSQTEWGAALEPATWGQIKSIYR
jgi:hypothetical protein